jgi:hypothetical protein
MITVFSPSFDEIEICSNVIDGDTFDTSAGSRIRLADVDTPELGEQGYEEASIFLSDWILGEFVYLDVDDVYRFDTIGSRVVCVVYVEVENGKYLNLNKALLDEKLAVVWDHDNEFNPYSWSMYVYELSFNQRMIIIGFSFFICLIVVYVINGVKKRAQRILKYARTLIEKGNYIAKGASKCCAPLITSLFLLIIEYFLFPPRETWRMWENS